MRLGRIHRACFVFLAGLGFVLAANPGFACAVCFGDPDSEMVHGAKAGVLFLAGLVYFQLMLFTSVIVFWMIRARKLQRSEASAES